jgi:hypothetical protein
VYTIWVGVNVADGEGVSVSVGGGVPVGARVEVPVDTGIAVLVALSSGTGVSEALKVAVTTMISGEEQSHCVSGSGVSVGVGVIVAVFVGVSVILGVRVGVFVLNSIKTGSSGPPVSSAYSKTASINKSSRALLMSPYVKSDFLS